MMTKLLLPLLALLAGFASAQDTPRWDNTGNSLLKGKYRFREVAFRMKNDAGDFTRALSMNGTFEFDGDGRFQIIALVLDSDIGELQRFTKSGTYRIAASGLGFIESPIFSDGLVFGLVSNGIFIGSSTEDGINDMLIAAAESEQPPTNEALQGRYRVAEVNFRGTSLAQTRGAAFDLTPDGQGNLAAISAVGYIGGNTRRLTQTVTGAGYSFTDGQGNLRYGGTLTDTNFLTGDRVFFVSADRNFIFGGSATGFDLFAGARALTEDAPPSLLDGLHFEAGIDADLDEVADGFATINSYLGSARSRNGDTWGHQRLFTGLDPAAYDYTYSDLYELTSAGIYEDFFGFRHFVAAGGNIRIGFGQESVLGLHIGLRAPTLEGTGVFLNPTGIINAASRTPFTVGAAPGTLLLLDGTNLAPSELVDPAFPTTLGGVQVLFNGKPAPITRVSPTRITVQAPFDLTGQLTEVQVMNNGEASNKVTTYVTTSAPGVFTNPAGGIGYSVAFHADQSPVTTANPARSGETVTVHVAGLGPVDPAVVEGAPVPDPPSIVTQPVDAYFDGRKGVMKQATLAPGLIGVYALQVEVPSGLTEDAYLDIATPDAYTSMAGIAIGPSTAETEGDSLIDNKQSEQRRDVRRRSRAHQRPQTDLTRTAPSVRRWNERNQ